MQQRRFRLNNVGVLRPPRDVVDALVACEEAVVASVCDEIRHRRGMDDDAFVALMYGIGCVVGNRRRRAAA